MSARPSEWSAVPHVSWGAYVLAALHVRTDMAVSYTHLTLPTTERV